MIINKHLDIYLFVYQIEKKILKSLRRTKFHQFKKLIHT